MINANITGQAQKKIAALKRTIGSLTTTKCEITPSHVIYLHCERQNKKLLEEMPSSAHESVKAKWKPKVEAASKECVKDLKAQESLLARAWRYAAYVYIDKLWLMARDGSWGKVKSSTEWVKATEVQGAQGRIQDEARARGRAVRGTAARSLTWMTNYGVRQIERGRRWYEIQKGRQKHGQRTDGDLTESESLVVISMNGRRIGTGG